VHDCGEDHHLLTVPGGSEEEHCRSDSDRDITFGVADRLMTIHLGKLDVDQIVEMLLVTGHGRHEVGALQFHGSDRSATFDWRRRRLEHLCQLIRCEEDRVLDTVDIA
jgi:hypothetical protein